MELKQSEYEKKSKEVEIQKLEDSIENADVICEMAGIVKSINNGTNENVYYYGGESQAFMEIIAMGESSLKRFRCLYCTASGADGQGGNA